MECLRVCLGDRTTLEGDRWQPTPPTDSSSSLPKVV